MPLRVGILALQGAFAKHGAALVKMGAEPILVKKPDDLQNIDGLIIPGGESTTILRQIHFIDLFPALSTFAQKKPIFGTCAGLILMSREVLGFPSMHPLHALDISIERNAFGSQTESFSANLQVNLPSEGPFSFPAIFIRAPRIKQVGPEVTVLGTYQNEPVLVQQGIHLGCSFHPELSSDLSIHRYFLALAEKLKGNQSSL